MPKGVYKHKKGIIPWNKGKILLDRRGKNSPSWKGGDVTKKCLQCGNIFTRALNRKGRTAKFCTKKCSEDSRNEGKTTLDKIIRKSKKYKDWRKEVFKRDDFTCKKTGKKGGNLVVHHINNFSEFEELRYEVDNGVTLSVESHQLFHKIYGFRNNTKGQLEKLLTQEA